MHHLLLAALVSKALFYVAAGLLAVWAVVVSAIGISRPDFPGAESRARGVMALSVLFVAFAMISAVITS